MDNEDRQDIWEASQILAGPTNWPPKYNLYVRAWIPPAVAKQMGAEQRWWKHEIQYTKEGKNIHYLDGVRITTEEA